MGLELDFSSLCCTVELVQQCESATLLPGTIKANIQSQQSQHHFNCLSTLLISMRFHCCWLLAAWATVSCALSVASPTANTTINIGRPFTLAWTYTQTTASTDVVTISLLASPSTSDVVAVLAVNIPERYNSWLITVNQADPNTKYFLLLKDTTSPGVVAGPYYFATIEQPTAPEWPSSPKLPGYAIAIIVIVAVFAVIAIILVCWCINDHMIVFL
jgi:hypothetical protein